MAEHKTPATAVDAYCHEVSRKEILELENDLDRFIKKTRASNFDDLRELFVRDLHSGGYLRISQARTPSANCAR